MVARDVQRGSGRPMNSDDKTHGKARWRTTVAVALACLAAASPSDAIANCLSGSSPARYSPQALDAAAADQKHEIEVLKDRMRRFGCSEDGVVILDGTGSARCVDYGHLLSSMQDNLAAIEEQRSRAAVPATQSQQPCRTRAPIKGVSQFLDPAQSDVEDLSPHGRSSFVVPSPVDGRSITRIVLPSDTDTRPPYPDEDGYGALPPIEVEVEPPAIARPMTGKERNVRRVGPRFLPEPSQSLGLGPDGHNR